MSKFIVVLVLLLALVACGDQDVLPLPDDLANAVGVSETEADPVSVAPRVEATPTPPLPPTFTPDPRMFQGHLYLLPVSGADGVVRYVYIVRTGDTLAEICRYYNVSLADVVRINKLADPNHIEVGMQLIMPVVK
jgi:predicted small lipoprotein YifL